MKESWDNKEFVQDWDTRISQKHPTRFEQLDILVSVIAETYKLDNSILDIGVGSGQVEELIFNKIPNAKIIGVDSSSEMADLAKIRLSKYGEKFKIILKNIPDLQISDLPKQKYKFVISVQMLHEISNEQKAILLQKIYELLEDGGQFLIMDRIKVDLETFSGSYSGVWKRLEEKYNWNSATSYKEYAESIKEKHDAPATLLEHLQLLEHSGFKATVLHAHFDRVLIVGVKK